MSRTAKTITFTSTTNRYGEGEVEGVLAVEGARGSTDRFGLGFIPEGAEARQVMHGPMVPGPWAFAFGLCSVIDCHGGTGAERKRNIEKGIEHDVTDGDTVIIDGIEFAVRVVRNGFDRRVKLDIK